MKTLVPSHPKTRMLADLLGIRLPEAVGILAMLWNYGKQSAKDGDLSSLKPERLALLLGWSKDQGDNLYAALCDAGWVDPHPHKEGAFVIHDWLQHCEGYVVRDLVNAGRLKHHTERAVDPVEFYRAEPANAPHDMHGAAVHALHSTTCTAQHDMSCFPSPSPPPPPPPSSKPKPKPTPADAGSACEDGDSSFDAWYESYPVRGKGVPRGNRKAAFRAWVKLRDADRSRVVEATRRLIASGQIPKDAERFLRPGPHGADPPWQAWLDDTPGATVAAGTKPKTAANRREEGNHEYDQSGLDSLIVRG